MTEEDYKEIGELLKRRDNQRLYADQQRKRIAEAQLQLEVHTTSTRDIHRRLYELGYTGQ